MEECPACYYCGLPEVGLSTLPLGGGVGGGGQVHSILLDWSCLQLKQDRDEARFWSCASRVGGIELTCLKKELNQYLNELLVDAS